MSSEIKRIEDAHLAKFFARKTIDIVRGKGAFVYDSGGREFIDCTGSYGTCIVGHAHPKVARAICEQASKLISCHASTYNDARARFLLNIESISPPGLDRVFPSNSGAEAVECAIKLARKRTGRRKIVAMKGGFHGKTHGALSATWDGKYRKSFEPLVPDFVHVSFGDSEAAKVAVDQDTAAVLVEPVQGEGGVRVPPPDWLAVLRDLTDECGALLIADEIQTGFGRTGKMFACDHYGVVPDILCLGKGIASGLPIGLTIARDDVMSALSVGEHTSTFSGNPIVCAATSATIEVLLEEHLIERAQRSGDYLKSRLCEIAEQNRIVREVRGLGLMLGVETRFDVHQILTNALERGALLLDAGRNIIRFLPPLCIDTDQIDRVLSVLGDCLEREGLEKIRA
jgi:LysW-gamma-L-lysine/LysW-L-ornithine aminotransferase